MNLEQTLSDISTRFNLATPDELINYAYEDEIGGYHSDKSQEKWPVGSIWGVEGQVLYAIIRALKPEFVIELGGFYGCSTSHILAALHKNDYGKVYCVDNNTLGVESVGSLIPQEYRARWDFAHEEAVTWLLRSENMWGNFKSGLIFEDLDHSLETTREVWKAAYRLTDNGGFILSHDAMHEPEGTRIRAGIMQSGIDMHNVRFYPIEPSDCGLAVYRKQGVLKDYDGATVKLESILKSSQLTRPVSEDEPKVIAPARKRRKRKEKETSDNPSIEQNHWLSG